jgi:hypothetical protein
MPNWYGIEGIKFECHGQQDGLLYYKEHIFNANDIQDSLWEFYQEDTENGLEWEEFVIANAIGYLEDLINSEGEY